MVKNCNATGMTSFRIIDFPSGNGDIGQEYNCFQHSV
jgi:hypothetical protein